MGAAELSEFHAAVGLEVLARVEAGADPYEASERAARDLGLTLDGVRAALVNAVADQIREGDLSSVRAAEVLDASLSRLSRLVRERLAGEPELQSAVLDCSAGARFWHGVLEAALLATRPGGMGPLP